jgi:uncharacterized protein
LITPEIQQLLDYADESHKASKVLIDKGFIGFSAAQSYYTMFYLTEALLLSKGLHFSSHSAVIAAFGKEFAKTGLFDPKFHRYIIDAEERREDGEKSLMKMHSSPFDGRPNSENLLKHISKLRAGIH